MHNHPRQLKGIVHCHTTYSYDGVLTIQELCDLLRSEGFDFVALTEHTHGLTRERYEQLVRECRAASDEKFLAIPGLELRCGNGIEIVGIGITQWLEDGPPETAVAAIRQAGGFAIWVHPFKSGRWSGSFLECDAVEVLNGKVDGVWAPNFSLLREFARQRRQGRSFTATFGLDFHNYHQQRCVWIECTAQTLGREEIVRALRDGQFQSHVSHGVMSSDGKTSTENYLKMASLRCIFRGWVALLSMVPKGIRSALVNLARPISGSLKRRA